jgi:hypothetical protein
MAALGRSLLAQEAHDYGAPQIHQEQKNTKPEFPNTMTLSVLYILSECLPLFICLGLTGQCNTGTE